MTRFKDSAPVFVVPDVRATAEHYRDVFGFCFGDILGVPADFAMLFRDGATIVLRGANGPVRPNGAVASEAADAFIGVEDVKRLAGELQERGADIVLPPTFRPSYDGWEMTARDCDGRLILFTQAD